MPFHVEYDSASRTVFSSVSGILSPAEVTEWESALYETTRSFGSGSRFQFVDDLLGYEVAYQDLAVHNRMREVTPRFLADHGFAVGF